MRRRTREPRALAVSALIALAIALPLTAPWSVASDPHGAADALPGTDFRGVWHVGPTSESAAVTPSNPSERSSQLAARSRLLQPVADLSAGALIAALVLAALAFVALGSAQSIQRAV